MSLRLLAAWCRDVLQVFAVDGPGPCQALAVNGGPIPFETDLFKGVVAVYIRHLPTTPPHMFKGKKRLAWVALQVRGGVPVMQWAAAASCDVAHAQGPSAAYAGCRLVGVRPSRGSLLTGLL